MRGLGARFDEWLNLFGEHDENEEPGIDEQFGKLEQLLVDEYKRGGVTAQAKQAIDRALDTLQEKPPSHKAIGSGSAISDKVGKSDT